MKRPVVAIVGRPNVGKSTLFNALSRRRIAIVEPTAGVTRDRVATEVQIGARTVELIDTGGIGIVDDQKLADEVERQIETAMACADALLFVVDVRAGLTPFDREIAVRLRKLGKPIVLVANKVDSEKQEPLAHEFRQLGLGEPVLVCARQGHGREALAEALLPLLPSDEALAEAQAAEPPVMKIAIVGKRNAGKSTFVNALCREPRMIVSDIPGTTRDAVDCRFERDGEVFVAIDTAGMRKKKSVEDAVEFFSHVRTEQAIRRADVVLLVLDVTKDVSQVDKALADMIVRHAKPCVIVGNKWDLAEGRMTTEAFDEYMQKKLPGLHFCPVVFTQAIRGRGVGQVLRTARELYRQARVRVGTGELNRVIRQAVEQVRPRAKRPRPGLKHVRPRIYYAAQIDVAPPTIALVVNKPELLSDWYQRYLINRLREHFPFAEVPLRLVLRERPNQYVGTERAERRRRRKRAAGRGGDGSGDGRGGEGESRRSQTQRPEAQGAEAETGG
ncbi:MAG: ribosome biogenesis GTPase Der [Planctomycetota bacterium]|nr:MAG: ribosome biogenesis GTPase Der [Planctomycetota bacterium]